MESDSHRIESEVQCKSKNGETKGDIRRRREQRRGKRGQRQTSNER